MNFNISSMTLFKETPLKNRIIIIAALAALLMAGCALSTVQTFMRNISAADCATPASQQAFIGNLPQVAFMTNAQATALMSQYCIGQFGTVAAPTPAPGMSGAFPAPTPVPAK